MPLVYVFKVFSDLAVMDRKLSETAEKPVKSFAGFSVVSVPSVRLKI